MKQTQQLAIFCLILLCTLSTITCFNSDMKVDALNKLDPNSKFNGFQDINIAVTGDEGVFVDIDDSTMFRDQINYRKTPNIYSYNKDYIYQLSNDIVIEKPMARLSFKLDLPNSYIYCYNNMYVYIKVALLFGNSETEIGFGFFGVSDRYGLSTSWERSNNSVHGTVFNVPIGVHPIKFRIQTTTNLAWMSSWFYSSTPWGSGSSYPMMDVEGELIKPAKKDKKALVIIPKDETSTARPQKKGRFVSTDYTYSYPYTYTYSPSSKSWRYQYRTSWSQGSNPWAYTSMNYRKLYEHDATVGETFARWTYYPNGSVWASVKGTLSFYDAEGWWGFKHTDSDWNCNQCLTVDSYNNSSYCKMKKCNDNNNYTKNKWWQKVANMTQSKWLKFKHVYSYFYFYMYTIPKVTKKSAIYFATENISTVKITAKGKSITQKKSWKHDVNAVFESQYKKALKSNDTITFEVDSGKLNAYLTAVINYKDSKGIIRLLSADKYMDCGKGQDQKRITTLYANVNNAPMITLLSGKATYFVGQEKKKIKCTVKLP
jgi:hypothetical protein